MAHYLVSAVPRTDRLDELRARLTRDEFRELQPFGRALTKSLRDTRIRQAILANPGITERLGQGAAKRLQLAKLVPGETSAKLIEAVSSGDGAHEIMGHG